MHMILISANFQKLDLISTLNFDAYLFQNIIHLSVKYSTSILCRKYQVIHQYRNVMTLMEILAHSSILRRKRRRIEPEGIKQIV